MTFLKLKNLQKCLFLPEMQFLAKNSVLVICGKKTMFHILLAPPTSRDPNEKLGVNLWSVLNCKKLKIAKNPNCAIDPSYLTMCKK